MPRPTPQELAKTFGITPDKAREAAAGFYGADAPELTLPSEDETDVASSTLPQTGQPAGLLGFKETMDKVINLAKQSRNEQMLGFMAPFQGTVAASDFSSILGNMNRASDTFSEDVLKASLPGKLETQLVEVGGRKLLVNSQTGDTIKDLGMADKPGSGSSTSNQQTDNERALMGTFITNPIVKNYNDIVAQKNTIDNYISNGVGGPSDLALVFAFMKGLDPNSVVRETEYDTAAKSGNIFQGKFAKFNGYFKEEGGFLPDAVKKEFQNLIDQRLRAQTVSYDNFAKSIKDIAKRQGMNPDNVVPNFSAASPQSAPAKATPLIAEPQDEIDEFLNSI